MKIYKLLLLSSICLILTCIDLCADCVPTVRITSPANNSTFTALANVVVNVSATAGCYGQIYKVQYYKNGGSRYEKYDGAPNPYTYTWTNLSHGSYALMVTVYDGVGNTASTTVNIVVNAPAPSVTLTAPSNNSSYVAPAKIVLSASTSTTYGSVSKVEFYKGSTLIGTSFSAQASYTWNNVVAGSYSITAKAYTNNGSTSTTAPITVSVYDPPGFIAFDNQCVNKLKTQ